MTQPELDVFGPGEPVRARLPSLEPPVTPPMRKPSPPHAPHRHVYFRCSKCEPWCGLWKCLHCGKPRLP